MKKYASLNILLTFFWILISSSNSWAITFKDMPEDHWAMESVNKMNDLGIISGYPDGTFKGTKNINRYELSLYLYKTISYIDSPKPTSSVEELAKEIKLLKEEIKALKTEIKALKIK